MKKLMQKSLNLLLCFLMITMNFSPLFMSEVKAEAGNTGGMYGFVYFRTKGCGTNTNYINDLNGKSGYTNGCYGADAAFLGYNANKTKVKFKLAGVVGWVNANDVVVKKYVGDNYNWNKLYTSNYSVENGILKHNVMSDIYNYEDGDSITLGPKPSFLTNGQQYWSYDGHYFYPATETGYINMIKDYTAGNYNNAINKTNPYYNYYQYLSHRTQSNYTNTDILNYLKGMGINAPMTSWPAAEGQSLLYGEQTSFVQYQNQFGANLALVLGLAQNESANGTSNIAFYGNNLFGHEAFDSLPGAATEYANVAQSIYGHTKGYVSEGYLDPCDQRNAGGKYSDSVCQLGRYNGAHVGDKASGLNVKYASDPYWGEKAAQYYYMFDESSGNQDYNKYTIAIKKGTVNVPVYKETSTSSTLLYKTGTATDYPVVVLGETTVNGVKWYKIQSDTVLNSTRTGIVQDSGYYDYKHNYGYVQASNFIKINTGKTLKNRYTITFNPNGGKFTDGETTNKKLTVEQNQVPVVNAPTKAGDTFLGWSPAVMGATRDVTYVAQWKNTKYNITFNANGGKFSDGTTSKIVTTPINTKPSITNPTRAGYIFKGWDKTIANATANATYTAVWEKIVVKYNITFDANGGKFNDGTTSKVVSTIEDEKPVIPNEPTRDGYEFTGWDTTVTVATGAKTYKATWKEVVSYDITFDANGGKFSDGKTTKIVKTNEGKIPNISEVPQRDGFIFVNWDKELTTATGETTYKATWKEGTVEDLLTKRNGWFHLEEAIFSNNNLKLSGFSIVTGINNLKNDDSVQFKLILKEQNTNKQIEIKINRWLDRIPFIPNDGTKLDYSGSWFNSEIDLTNIPQGDYTMYIQTIVGDFYTNQLISNIEYTDNIVRKYQDKNNRGYLLKENDVIPTIPLELFIRDEGLISYGKTPIANTMYNDFFDYDFIDNGLLLRGSSYALKLDYNSKQSVAREIILENAVTHKIAYRKDVGSITDGPYKIASKTGNDLTRAWFNNTLDLSNLEKGTYVIYVKTKVGTSEDYSELVDYAYSDFDKTKIINNKKIFLKRNDDKRLRVELVIE